MHLKQNIVKILLRIYIYLRYVKCMKYIKYKLKQIMEVKEKPCKK